MISDHAGRASGGLWRDRRGFSVFFGYLFIRGKDIFVNE